MTPAPTLPDYFFRTNDSGLIEAIDKLTGRVIAVQATPKDLLEQKWDNLVRIDTPEGPVWLEKGLNYDIIANVKGVPYSKVIGDLLCEKIVQGEGLVKACELVGTPYHVVKRWERDSESFRDQLKQARLDRAEYFHDEIIEKARAKAEIKDELNALKWAAEKGNPERYGTQTKITGDKDSPVQFIISTGITREEPPREVAPQQLEKDAKSND